ncbi:MAG: PAAR domain-containing protein [Bacteroidota bacterium]
MPDAARITDIHQCPLQTPGLPPIPHTAGGLVIQGCPTVLIGGLPAARVGDQLLCVGPPPHPDTVIVGSMTVLIGGMPAARMGDPTAMGGKVQLGLQTVDIGG